jgi:hypothetical protein
VKRFLVLIAFLNCIFLHAQDLSQRVNGRVVDKSLRSAIAGVNIILIGVQDTLHTNSDAFGYFSVEQVFPGRYQLQASHTGYQSLNREVLVISARSTEVSLFMEESSNVLKEVEVTARSLTSETGVQSITIEKALRVPANFFDPVRVLTTYPGVMTANDQNNTIVIRANSPAGLLWKVNGLDVVNPNHLANAGTFSDKPAAYGGGVNIISSQLLDRTDFYTGSFPVQYGNAMSGIVNMNLREGDKREEHFIGQVSLIGLDVAADGPIGKKENTSFVVNYRSSTIAVLSALGAKFGDEDINFQDLTFSIDSRLSKEKKLSVFGFFGMSKNDFEHKDSLKWELDKDQYDIKYASRNFGMGMTMNQTFKNVHASTGISISGNDQSRDQFASPQIDLGKVNVTYLDQYSDIKYLVSAFGRLTAKINSNILESGITVNYMTDDILTASQYGISPTSKLTGTVEGLLFQPYVQWRMFLSEKWIAQSGLRYMHYTFNNSGVLEPRIAIEFIPNAQSSVRFTYNLVSQVQQAATYLNQNKNLALSKSHHFDLSVATVTSKSLQFTANLYYQMMWDIPVQKNPSSYSALNSIETWGQNNLISAGTGNNYGVEVLTEKSFYDKSYFIVGGSWYKSTYQGSDGIQRSTRFDGNYSVNMTYGKEWSKEKKSSYRTFGVSSRLLYLGGLRESPIIPDQNSPTTIHDETKAFENKLSDYFRFDLRLNWRKNKNGYTRTIAIDIQNLFNSQNEAYHYYDHIKNKINKQYQLGVIPILVYRFEF